jgi:hypothetical protein
MKRLVIAAVLVVALAPTTPAAGAALRIVTLATPAINCLFDRSCKVVVEDTSASIPVAASGARFVQSRTFQGKPGTPADGLYAYEYRIDLTRAVGIVDIPCVTSLTIPFGPLVNTLDYNGDGKPGDHVWVVTSGGGGSIGLAEADQVGWTITFTFAAPVCAGGQPGTGDASFFFGLISRRKPAAATVTIADQNGTTYKVEARAPLLKPK